MGRREGGNKPTNLRPREGQGRAGLFEAASQAYPFFSFSTSKSADVTALSYPILGRPHPYWAVFRKGWSLLTLSCPRADTWPHLHSDLLLLKASELSLLPGIG